jgi:competence ComEA-like helix-hairpin-helix protein
MKKAFGMFFHFSRGERNGIVVLLLICLLSVIFPQLLPVFFPKAQTDFQDFQADIAAFEATVSSSTENITAVELFAFNPNEVDLNTFLSLGLSEKVARTILNYRSKGGRFRKVEDFSKIYSLSQADFERLKPYIKLDGNPAIATTQPTTATVEEIELFFFNPNLVTIYDLQRLGLSPKIAQTIVNYRDKGGKFKTADDLKKIYGFSQADFTRLKPYIQIEETPSVNTSNQTRVQEKEEVTLPTNYEKTNKKNIPIDINKATAEEWQQLYGIGAAYANRIVKFREALGGFTSVAQVAETYQLPDSTFQKIKPFLLASAIQRKLAINQADVSNLSAHPYLSGKEAQIIVNYRTQHGNFKSFEDLKKVKALSEGTLQKIEPYLIFD